MRQKILVSILLIIMIMCLIGCDREYSGFNPRLNFCNDIGYETYLWEDISWSIISPSYSSHSSSNNNFFCINVNNDKLQSSRKIKDKEWDKIQKDGKEYYCDCGCFTGNRDDYFLDVEDYYSENNNFTSQDCNYHRLNDVN